MENQFCNDGEMPPEIAAQFPVLDQWQKDHVRPKSKEPGSPGLGDTILVGGLLNVAVVMLLAGKFEFALFLGFAMMLIVFGNATDL